MLQMLLNSSFVLQQTGSAFWSDLSEADGCEGEPGCFLGSRRGSRRELTPIFAGQQIIGEEARVQVGE